MKLLMQFNVMPKTQSNYEHRTRANKTRDRLVEIKFIIKLASRTLVLPKFVTMAETDPNNAADADDIMPDERLNFCI